MPLTKKELKEKIEAVKATIKKDKATLEKLKKAKKANPDKVRK